MLFSPEPPAWRLWLKKPESRIDASLRNEEVSRSKFVAEDADPPSPSELKLTERAMAGASRLLQTSSQSIKRLILGMGDHQPSTAKFSKVLEISTSFKN
jgi:hypothetical protein